MLFLVVSTLRREVLTAMLRLIILSDFSADHLYGRRYCGYSGYALNSIRLDVGRQFAASRVRPCLNLKW